MKKLVVTGERVLCEREQTESEGLVLLPSPKQCDTARVLAVGPKCQHVKAGTRILLRHTVGYELTLTVNEDRPLRKLLLVDEKDIDGIVE